MKIEFTNRCRDIAAPSKASERSAGFDLRAAVDTPIVLAPGARALVPTGICMAIPAGHEAQVRPRSGLAANHGVTLLNSPGTIDSDYRGEVAVLLINHGSAAFAINRGDRIAQLVIAALAPAQLEEVSSLDKTERGDGGFGSSGVR
jgi:dUTP pyrophosphatase